MSEEFHNIIDGDYNCISNAKLDKFGGNPNARPFAAITQLFMEFVRDIIYLIFGRIDTRISDASLGLRNIPQMEQSYVHGLTNS